MAKNENSHLAELKEKKLKILNEMKEQEEKRKMRKLQSSQSKPQIVSKEKSPIKPSDNIKTVISEKIIKMPKLPQKSFKELIQEATEKEQLKRMQSVNSSNDKTLNKAYQLPNLKNDKVAIKRHNTSISEIPVKKQKLLNNGGYTIEQNQTLKPINSVKKTVNNNNEKVYRPPTSSYTKESNQSGSINQSYQKPRNSVKHTLHIKYETERENRLLSKQKTNKHRGILAQNSARSISKQNTNIEDISNKIPTLKHRSESAYNLNRENLTMKNKHLQQETSRGRGILAQNSLNAQTNNPHNKKCGQEMKSNYSDLHRNTELNPKKVRDQVDKHSALQHNRNSQANTIPSISGNGNIDKVNKKNCVIQSGGKANQSSSNNTHHNTINNRGIVAQGSHTITTQNNRGIATQNNRGVTTQNNRGVTTQNNRGVTTQNNREVAAKNDRGISAQNNRGIAAQNNRGIAAQINRGIVAQNNRGIAAQNNRGIAAQNNRGIAAQYGTNKIYDSCSEDEYDPEMDDFIDDTEDCVTDDIRKEIYSCLRFNPNKYEKVRMDDNCGNMESSVKQIRLEEERSYRLAREEDKREERLEEERLRRKGKL